MRASKRLVVASALVGWVVAVGVSASAGIAYQGDDTSNGVQGNTRVNACDNEADGFGVHADGENMAGSDFRVDDTNGSAAGCANSGYMGSVKRHRTVEERPSIWEPDVKGDWHNH